MTMSTLTHRDAHAGSSCTECSVAMLAVGGGRHTDWSCTWCAETTPRPS